MRSKRKKHGAERLEACSAFLTDLASAGNYAALFGNGNPVRIEIGCGKGDFIVGTAANEPQVNFLAVERVHDVLMMAAEKVRDADLQNVRLCLADVKELQLPAGSVDRLYLNFSDPWPKNRHAKRRLTARSFLQQYEKFLRPGGQLCFKTDNAPLFEFTLEELQAAGWTVDSQTDDLHASPENEGNVETEYERRFSALGFPIHRVVAHKN